MRARVPRRNDFQIVAFLLSAILLAASPSIGWDTKATWNIRIASQRVGAFSPDQAHLYALGLNHIRNRHLNIGTFTIRRVVAEERSREHQRTVARAHASGTTSSRVSSNDDAIGGGVIIGVLVFAVLAVFGGLFAAGALSRQNARFQAAAADSKRQIESLAEAGPLPPIHVAGIMEHSSELIYWGTASVNLFGDIHHKEYIGGSTGVSFRVARGVYVHSSGSHGHTVDRVTTGALDNGRLLLTGTRLLFLGAKRTITAEYKHVVSIEPFVDGMKLTLDHGKPLAFQTGTQCESTVMRRLIAGDRSDHRPTASAVVVGEQKALPSSEVSQ